MKIVHVYNVLGSAPIANSIIEFHHVLTLSVIAWGSRDQVTSFDSPKLSIIVIKARLLTDLLLHCMQPHL